MEKIRLDLLLVEQGLATNVDLAQALIGAGMVEVGQSVAITASKLVSRDVALRIIGDGPKWASRAGDKLEGAVAHFKVALTGRVALDCGASTGGFVDVLLHGGARLVYAIDVGYGQLQSRLANDSRVVVMDRTNLRHVTELSGEPPSLATLDMSFISLTVVMPSLVKLLQPPWDVLALFKPQFELGREMVGPGGIVKDEAKALEAALAFAASTASQFGASTEAPFASPVRGGQGKGNQEWFVYLHHD